MAPYSPGGENKKVSLSAILCKCSICSITINTSGKFGPNKERETFPRQSNKL